MLTRLLAICTAAVVLPVLAAPAATAAQDCQYVSGKIQCSVAAGGSKEPVRAVAAAGAPECAYKGKPVPCTGQNGWYNAEQNCYVGSAVLRTRRRDGQRWQLRACIAPDGGGSRAWVLANPPAPPPPPPPVLADRLFQQMPIRKVNIGITPYPGGLGLVGLPTYLWVKNPAAAFGEHAIGPLCVRGVCVQGESTIDKVVWRLGDGTVKTCYNTGTSYQDRYGRESSPTCGHRYQHAGRYTVEATTDWTFHWTGGGMSGTIPARTTATVTIEIGEAQAVRR